MSAVIDMKQLEVRHTWPWANKLYLDYPSVLGHPIGKVTSSAAAVRMELASRLRLRHVTRANEPSGWELAHVLPLPLADSSLLREVMELFGFNIDSKINHARSLHLLDVVHLADHSKSTSGSFLLFDDFTRIELKVSGATMEQAVGEGITRGWWPFPEKQPHYHWHGWPESIPRPVLFISLALWGAANVRRLEQMARELAPFESHRNYWRLDTGQKAVSWEPDGTRYCLSCPALFEVFHP